MDSFQIFGLQFLLSLIVYGLIAKWYVAPRLAAWPLQDALILLLFPHAFRHLGMVFLVPAIVGPHLARGLCTAGGLRRPPVGSPRPPGHPRAPGRLGAGDSAGLARQPRGDARSALRLLPGHNPGRRPPHGLRLVYPDVPRACPLRDPLHDIRQAFEARGVRRRASSTCMLRGQEATGR